MGKNYRPQGRNKEKELGCSETTLEKTIRLRNWGRRGLNVATLSVRLHSACKPRMIGRRVGGGVVPCNRREKRKCSCNPSKTKR